ncbi:MAG TPA: DUF2905 domain-containing protein [Bryobacteraceae bacterium]|nr:DUF2905 domain-containing protein [Bryobacteraceae bacterium]
MGRLLIYAGAALMLVGLIVIAAGKIGLPIGRLPGDVVWRGKNTTFYFPLVTCLLLSLVLSIVAWLFRR